MRSWTTAAMILLTTLAGLAPLPTSPAQAPGVDVAILSVALDRGTVGGTESTILVTARMSTAGTASFIFTYADGVGVTDPSSPGGEGYTIVKAFRSTTPDTVQLSFTPPPERAGEQRIVVRASTTGDGDPTNDVGELLVFVVVPQLVASFVPTGEIDRLPNATTTLLYTIDNLGNAPDRPTLLAPATPGWSIRPTGEVPAILPGGRFTGALLVTPTTADPASLLRLDLSVVTEHRRMSMATATAPLLRPNASAIDAPRALGAAGIPASVQLFPGVASAFLFNVTNTGTAADVVAVSVAPANRSLAATIGAAPAWPANESLPTIENATVLVPLAPGASRPLALTLASNFTEPERERSVQVTIVSMNERLVATRAYPVNLTLSAAYVEAGPDLVLSASIPDASIYQDEATAIRFFVENRGRVAANASVLSLEMRDNLRRVANATLQVPALLPHASVEIVHPVETSGLSGEHSVLARVDLDATQQDRDPASNALSTILVVRVPHLQLRVPAEVHATPGAVLRVATTQGGLAITNTGSHAERADVRLDGEASWVEAAWGLDLGVRETRALVLEIEVPARPGVRTLTATVEARLANESSYVVSAPFTVVIDDDAPPTIGLSVPPTSQAHVEATLRATIVDATGVAEASLVVEAPSGARTTVPMSQGEGDAFLAAFTPREIGVHQLHVRATDDAIAANEAVSARAPWNVTGLPFLGLVPDGFEDGGLVKDRRLAFKEAVEGSVATATADVGSGAAPLAFPFAVTLPVAEGDHTVVVRTVAHDGREARQTWKVRLDTTPPSVAGAKADLAGDGRWRVVARAEGASEVAVRFETPRGPVVVSLAPAGTGEWSGDVAPPAEWTQAAVLATDAAGNSASTPLSAPEAKTPFAAAPLVLAALAAVALAARRRRAK